MNYKEIEGNLFDAPQGFCLAHCIAGDFGMGAGIATQFNEKFNMRSRLKDIYESVTAPDCIKIDNVYNLITKNLSYKRPTYDNFTESLRIMKEEIVKDGVKFLAMPQIGCGLDGLNWSIVRAIIKDIFEDTDVNIVIYIYKQNNENDLNEYDIGFDADDLNVVTHFIEDKRECCPDYRNQYGVYDSGKHF